MFVLLTNSTCDTMEHIDNYEEGPCYKHDCEYCTFIGRGCGLGSDTGKSLDVYTHNTTVVLRASNEPSDYWSLDFKDKRTLVTGFASNSSHYRFASEIAWVYIWKLPEQAD